MKLVLSGEGATDLGAIQVGSNGEYFVPGPMALIVDKLLERYHSAYSLIDSHDTWGNCIVYVAKSELSSFAKKGPTLLPGQKYGKGNAFFVSNAQCLGLYAKKLSAEEAGIPVIAILFRDGDKPTPRKSGLPKLSP